MHWGIALKVQHRISTWLLASSNIIALFAWLILLFIHSPAAVTVMLILGFTYQLYVDQRLVQPAAISLHFYRWRKNVTAVVVILLIISLVLAVA